MALIDWVQYVLGTPTIEINSVAPIADVGSLHLTCHADEKILLLSQGYIAGLLKGRMRSLFRIDTVNGPETYRCGFTLFQSLPDITAGGSSYLYGIEFQTALASNALFFDQCTLGIDGGQTRVFSGPSFTRVNASTLIALEIVWAYEPTLLGGTRFLLREGHGTVADFSNLVDIETLHLYPGTGPGNPPLLTTSSGEGLYMTGGTSSTAISVNVDRTTIAELT